MIVIKNWMDMTRDEKKKRSIKCAIGSAIIAIVFVCLAMSSSFKAKSLRDGCTEVTTGEVISVFPSTKSRPQSYLTARYSVNGVTYEAEGHYRSGFSSSDTLSRKPVTVHFDPASPDVSYAADDPRTDVRFIFIVIAIVFIIAVPAFIVQAKRI